MDICSAAASVEFYLYQATKQSAITVFYFYKLSNFEDSYCFNTAVSSY